MTTIDAGIAVPSPGRAARTSAVSLEEVFRSLGPAVQGYLRASGASDSEELLGDVFERVARGIARFRGDEADLRRWVFTIAYRSLIDEHRRRARDAHLLRRARPTDITTPDEPFDPALLRALRELTPEQREVVTLRFVADLALEEVGRITGRPTGAVKSLQHRALRHLAQLLGAPRTT